MRIVLQKKYMSRKENLLTIQHSFQIEDTLYRSHVEVSQSKTPPPKKKKNAVCLIKKSPKIRSWQKWQKVHTNRKKNQFSIHSSLFHFDVLRSFDAIVRRRG